MRTQKLCLALSLQLCFAVCGGCSGASAPLQDSPKEEETPTAPQVRSLGFSDDLHEDLVNWYGRVRADGEKTDFSNSAAGFEVSFTGTALYAEIVSQPSSAPNEAEGNAYAYVFSEGERNYKRAVKLELLPKSEAVRYPLAEGLEMGEHRVKVLKCTEPKYGTAALLRLETDGSFLPPPPKPSLKFEILGDSIMSGSESMRGASAADSLLSSSENSLASYGYIAANDLRAQVYAITRSGGLLSGYKGFPSIPQFYDTYSQIDDTPWDFSRYRPDVIVLDLGTNDRLINAPEELIYESYLSFVRHIREKNPESAIFCCEGALLGTLSELTARAVEQLSLEGMEKIWHYRLPRLRTEGGHPNERDHKQNGNALSSFIMETLGLELS